MIIFRYKVGSLLVKDKYFQEAGMFLFLIQTKGHFSKSSICLSIDKKIK